MLEETFNSGAKREKSSINWSNLPWCALQRIAKIHSEGAARYGQFNYRKGMPKLETINHAMQHFMLYMEGDTSQDNLGKAAWGLLVLILEEEIEAGNFSRETILMKEALNK